MKLDSSSRILKIMVVIYCYFEREHTKFWNSIGIIPLASK